MKYFIYKPWVLLLTVFITPTDSFANSWTCNYAELTRHIVVFYPNEPSRLPCKVYYTKPNENVMPRTLWKAENEDNYCERNAIEFIKKLEALGWQCSIDNDQ
ncbi:MAG: hypothetical protein ABW139_07595 [Candidatus Thiodiazotropha sp. DIVDIV]